MIFEEFEIFIDVCDFVILYVFYMILRRKYCGRELKLFVESDLGICM